MSCKKTIYIVDDDEDDLFLMREVISDLQLNIDVHYASNGRQLLDILDKNIKNALILIDMNMPIMNGIETLKAVYADSDFKHLRSILISTSDRDELKQLALTSGAMKFICKPSEYGGYLQLMKDIFYKCF